MILFALPMILGNLLQQLYNIADTLIVGRFLGAGALAAVGSAYALMSISDIRAFRTVHGQRRRVFDMLGREKYGETKVGHIYVVCTDSCADCDTQRGCLSFYR